MKIHTIHEHIKKQRVLNFPYDKVIVDFEFRNEFSEYEELDKYSPGEFCHIVVSRGEFERVLKDMIMKLSK